MGILVRHFTHIFKRSIESGIFPNSLKVGTVTLIPKITNPTTCNDLRPISLLPLAGRILEQLVHCQTKNVLEHTNYLINQQYRFWNNRSTTKAVAKLMDKLLINADRVLLTVTVDLDFRKAFDTIDHAILL